MNHISKDIVQLLNDQLTKRGMDNSHRSNSLVYAGYNASQGHLWKMDGFMRVGTAEVLRQLRINGVDVKPIEKAIDEDTKKRVEQTAKKSALIKSASKKLTKEEREAIGIIDLSA